MTLAQSYLFLCDAARYVNHLYLYVLLSTLLLVAAADAPRGSRRTPDRAHGTRGLNSTLERKWPPP